MKYKPYPAYKDSGIEWLGEVPSHWDVKRLKYSTTINDEALPETTDPDFEFNYVDISSVSATDGIISSDLLTFENAPSRARRIARDGDTIISTVRTYLQAIAPVRNVKDNLIVSTGFAVVRPRTVHSGYLSYALRETTFVESIVARSVGVSYPAVNAADVAAISIALPHAAEQESIADFLDRQTGKLNVLIAKKREFIEKLKEKRTALISQTVTRGLPPSAAKAAGLNPNPKLKPSGVEWLGDVPEHWKVKRVKHTGMIRYGLGEPPEYVDEGLPFIRATDIKRGKVDLEAVQRVNPSDIPWSRKPKLVKGEILVVRSGAYTGDSALISQETAGCIAGYDMVLTVTAAEPRFISWVFLSRYMLDGQIYLERLRAAQPHLNEEELGNFAILIPPLSEQRAIADFLDHETSNIDLLIEKVESVIEKLQEYRSALITAAVTGKIDVRNTAARSKSGVV
jgi:type I restriction enzyme, S subunit